MKSKSHQDLSRRERQIMDLVFERGEVTAAEVQEGLPDPPSYSAVRAMLRILEDKGQLMHEQRGPRYVYRPARDRREAGRSALRHLMKTFFHGSTASTAAALLDLSSDTLTDEEANRLQTLIERARKEGR